MSSDNYQLQGGMTGMITGQSTSKDLTLSQIVGDTAAEIFTSKGYIINPNFPFGEAASSFSFSLSKLSIPLHIFPKDPDNDQSVKVFVSSGESAGFSIYAMSDSVLKTRAGTELGRTACDSEFPCTIEKASLWNENAGGLGYRAEGTSALADFSPKESYRGIPHYTAGESPSLIFSSSVRKTIEEGTIRFLARPFKNQPVGQYRTVVTVIAVPGI